MTILVNPHSEQHEKALIAFLDSRKYDYKVDIGAEDKEGRKAFLDQYNNEIDEAEAEIESGNYLDQDEVEKLFADRRKKNDIPLRMRFKLLAICLFCCLASNAQTIDSVYLNKVKSIPVTGDDFNKLLPAITNSGENDSEKLLLVYYWVYEHITFDTELFQSSGSVIPQDISKTLQSGKALCYDYDKLFEAACNYLNLPNYAIEGYVKFYGFKSGDNFERSNHIWHAVFINNTWKLTDLLWGSGTLNIKGNYVFVKKLHPEYFLADPKSFLATHLPADPIWQFENKPLSMSGFISKVDGIDTLQSESPINYLDSIMVMLKLKPGEREIKSAARTYNFNADNPNELIIAYYNQAVILINKPTASRAELIKAKTYFTNSYQLAALSHDQSIKDLGAVCEKGIISANNRLKKLK